MIRDLVDRKCDGCGEYAIRVGYRVNGARCDWRLKCRCGSRWERAVDDREDRDRSKQRRAS